MIYLLFLDAQSTSASCVFNCKRNEELKRVSKDRLKSTINASKQREDDLLAQLPIVDSYDDNCPLYCHRNCVSTYTSKNHIDRHLNQKRKSTVPEEKTSKRQINNFSLNRIVCSVEKNVLNEIRKTLGDGGFTI